MGQSQDSTLPVVLQTRKLAVNEEQAVLHPQNRLSLALELGSTMTLREELWPLQGTHLTSRLDSISELGSNPRGTSCWSS